MPATLKVVTIYTANFGDYDTAQEPGEKHPYADYLLFSDRVASLRGWQQFISQQDLSAVREARRRKCLSHLYSDTEYSIWHDANIMLLANPIGLCEMLGDAELMVFSHPYRACLYDEADTCIKLGKEEREILNAQITAYRAEGYPPDNGLCETGLLIRRHTEAIIRFNEMWWAEIEAGSYRDQVSFNYAVWKTGIGFKMIAGSLKRSPILKYSGRHNGQ